jgi:Protein of unknown function (DUF3311)
MREMGRRAAPVVLAAMPALALSLAIPFVNRFEPSLGGAPFLLVWIVGWVLASPFLLYIAFRLQQRT